MRVLEAEGEVVGTLAEFRVVVELDGGARRRGVGEGPRVAGHEADVELLGVERPYEAVDAEAGALAEELAHVERHHVGERREEVAAGEVPPAVALELAERQRAGLLDAVLRALVGQRGVGVAQAKAELGEELAEPYA